MRGLFDFVSRTDSTSFYWVVLETIITYPNWPLLVDRIRCAVESRTANGTVENVGPNKIIQKYL